MRTLKGIEFVDHHQIVYFREECEYRTEYREKCADKKEKVCEKFWKEDGYGGKVWTEDPSKCQYLEADECMDVPKPVKVCFTLKLEKVPR